jgi:hypothetical protein
VTIGAFTLKYLDFVFFTVKDLISRLQSGASIKAMCRALAATRAPQLKTFLQWKNNLSWHPSGPTG